MLILFFPFIYPKKWKIIKKKSKFQKNQKNIKINQTSNFEKL